MKLTKYLAGFSAFAFTTAAYADVTVNITGATAFRAATLQAIKAQYLSASSPSFKFAHDKATAGGTTYNGATRAIFIGNFPGVAGTTTIRCCFTGSVEGVRALVPTAVDPLPPTYYQPSLLSAVTATASGAELANQGVTGAAALGGISDIAFSDVSKAATPYASASLQPSSPNAGVIVFTMLTNEGSAVTNVTSQQFRALLSNGYQPLSLFTGNPAHTDYVFATGRNDGSGTRTTYLAESGYGIVKTVKQYVTNVSTSTALGTIQLVPAGGIVDQDPGTVGIQGLPGQSADNASTVWGQDVDGNGGYNSGSKLSADMGKTGTTVTVLDETGADAFGGAIPASLVTFVSVADAVTARNAGAVFCSYNGVKLDDIAAATAGSTYDKVMSAADKAKVTNGSYTAWGYERMYRRNDVTSGDIKTVYDNVKAALALPANLGSAGIPLGDMNVSRTVDGGIVAP